MTSPATSIRSEYGLTPAVRKLAKVSTLALILAVGLAGCKSLEDPGNVHSWTLVDPTERHPIMVQQKPARLHLKVPRGQHGLRPHQRARVANFLAHFRGAALANSKLVVAVPSGSPNEVAANQALADIRHLMKDYGYASHALSVETFHDEHHPSPPMRLSFTRYVAHGPECGHWPTNLAEQANNLPYPNMGCATQRNLAAQIANPGDLLVPRGMTGRDSDRRDVVFDKFIKGQSTISQKQSDERARAAGQN
ncbi:MAG: CpaD family pilus assembly protein [Pseudomonadota bacterium]